MLKIYYLICDVGLFFLVALRRVLGFNRVSAGNSQNLKAIIIGNGPSLKQDIEKIIDGAIGADIYCVNYMVLDKVFLRLKPRYYVLADPVFWRNDVSANVAEDNTRLINRLLDVDWKMDIFCPKEGAQVISPLLAKNKNLDVYSLPNISINFKFDKFTLWAFKYDIGSPIFINVLVMALWLAIKNKKKLIDIYGADFSTFRNIIIDQRTNDLYANPSHFYQNTKGQADPGNKYVNTKSKKMHTRMYQNWLAFQQMHLLSLHAKNLGIKITNRSSESYLDCFDRSG